MSLHLEMIAFWAIYIIATTVQFCHIDKKYMIALFLSPLVVLILIWIATHGMRSVDALIQFHRMETWLRQNNPKHLSGIRINSLADAIRVLLIFR
jgi:hypothetical protein